jgi:hypothetical protein
VDDIGSAVTAEGFGHGQESAPAGGIGMDLDTEVLEPGRERSLVGVGLAVVRQEEDAHACARP